MALEAAGSHVDGEPITGLTLAKMLESQGAGGSAIIDGAFERMSQVSTGFGGTILESSIGSIGDRGEIADLDAWETQTEHSSAQSVIEGTQSRVGRKRKVGPASCYCCAECSESDDPVAKVHDPMLRLSLRWAYPPKDGRVQGKFCWYCVKTVECDPAFAGMTTTQVVEQKNMKCPQHHSLFMGKRQTVIGICIDNKGSVTRAQFVSSDVMHYQQTSFHHKRHGKCVSLNRYKAKFGKLPDSDQLKTRVMRDGKVKSFVKIYANASSSEWSFSEDDAETVEKRVTIDDGCTILDENQTETQFEKACSLAFARPSKRLKAPQVGCAMICVLLYV